MAASETRSGTGGAARYTAVAIVLHWLIAAMILYQLVIGLWMSDALEGAEGAELQAVYQAVQTHKAIGLTILVLSVLRLVWRLLHPAPPLPATMGLASRLAAKASHALFYVIMVGAPLTGWAMVSSSPTLRSISTNYFDLFIVPHLPGFAAFSEAEHGLVANAHWLLGIGAAALLVLHVAAALKHHFVDGDDVLARMVPGVKPRRAVAAPPPPPRRPGQPILAGVVAAAALGFAGWVALSAWEPRATAAATTNADGAADPEAAGDAQAAGSAADDAEPGAPPRWAVVAEESAIIFTGRAAGAEFEGRFADWSADIRFDPERLAESRVRVSVVISSATTNDPTINASIANAEWLDAAGHPIAVFETREIRAGAETGAFVADGVLTLKGASHPVSVAFTLAIAEGRAEMAGRAALVRADFSVGAIGGLEDGMVSPEIDLDLRVVAVREETADAGAAQGAQHGAEEDA